MAKEPWVQVGSVLKKKDGKGTYLSVRLNKGKERLSELTLKDGMILTILDPRSRPNITEEELAKIPPFVKYHVFLAPSKE